MKKSLKITHEGSKQCSKLELFKVQKMKTVMFVLAITFLTFSYTSKAQSADSEYTNIALNKTVVVDSELNTSYPGSNAVDGDNISNSSRWISTGDSYPHYIEIDLDDDYEIGELKFFTGYNTYGTPIIDFQFQYYDGNSWVDIINISNNWVSAYSTTFTPVNANKVRLYITRVDADSPVKMFEIEVYGKTLNPLPISEEVVQGFKVYPNPCNNQLKIEGFSISSNKVEVYNVSGKLVLSVSGNSEGVIDVSDLNAGVYILKTDFDGKIITQRFIKQ